MKDVKLESIKQYDFKNYINMSDLQRIYEMTNAIIKVKKDNPSNYALIKDILSCYINNNQFYDQKRLSEIQLKKWQIIQYTLEFYKSIDQELYDNIKDIIFNRKPNLKINIYELESINNPNEKDVTFKEIKKYDEKPCYYWHNNKGLIYIPLSGKNNKSIAHKGDEGTLEDLYSIVHELAHTFDCHLDYIGDKFWKIYINDWVYCENIFDESIAIAFEKYLTCFLIKKGIINKENGVVYGLPVRNNDTLEKSQLAFAQLSLAEIKEKKGRITIEEIDEILNNVKMPQENRRLFIEKLLGDFQQFGAEEDLFINIRYGISGMISPTIVELLKQGKMQDVKEFFKASKSRDLNKALKMLGASQNSDGIRILEQNMKKYQDDVKHEDIEEQLK